MSIGKGSHAASAKSIFASNIVQLSSGIDRFYSYITLLGGLSHLNASTSRKPISTYRATSLFYSFIKKYDQSWRFISLIEQVKRGRTQN